MYLRLVFPAFRPQQHQVTYSEFKALVANRPQFDANAKYEVTQLPNPQWKLGQGANSDDWKQHKKVEFDPEQR